MAWAYYSNHLQRLVWDVNINGTRLWDFPSCMEKQAEPTQVAEQVPKQVSEPIPEPIPGFRSSSHKGYAVWE